MKSILFFWMTYCGGYGPDMRGTWAQGCPSPFFGSWISFLNFMTQLTKINCIPKWWVTHLARKKVPLTKRYWEKRLEEHTHVFSLTGKPLSGGQIFAPQQHVRAEKCSSSPHVQRDNFEIIGRENNSYVLKIKESIFIYKYKPKLNGTLSSAPLYLFT